MPMAGMLQAQNSFAIRQLAEAQAATREEKRLNVDDRHRYILTGVADFLDLAPKFVEDCILEGEQLDDLEFFFSEHGPRSLTFFFVPPGFGPEESPEEAEDEKRVAVMMRRRTRVILSDVKEVKFHGKCVACTRIRKRSITAFNIETDIIFNPVFARQEEIIQLDESGRLQHDVRFLGRRVSSEMTLGIEETLRFIFLPVLRANTDWGEELGSLKAIKVFLNDIAKYLKFSEWMRYCMSFALEFEYTDNFDFEGLNPMEMREICNERRDVVVLADELLQKWITYINRVLLERNWIRSVPSDKGPEAELKFWKERLCRMDSIIEFIKSKRCGNTRSLAQCARSRLMPEWLAMDGEVTAALMEARNNMKYLEGVYTQCKELMNCPFEKMRKCIPTVIQSIQATFQWSFYYKDGNAVAALFAEVSNLIIQATVNYLTASGTMSIWDHDPKDLREKLVAVIDLKNYYIGAYEECVREHTRQFAVAPLPPGIPEDPDKQDEALARIRSVYAGRGSDSAAVATPKSTSLTRWNGVKYQESFQFDKLFMFAKIDKYIKRLEFIRRALYSLEALEPLRVVNIDGLSSCLAEYVRAKKVLKRHQDKALIYDDGDFVDSTSAVWPDLLSLTQAVNQFLQASINDQRQHISRATDLLLKYEKASLGGEDFEKYYMRMLWRIGQDSLAVYTELENRKRDPPVIRDFPYYSNNVLWCRVLTSGVREAIEFVCRRRGSVMFTEGAISELSKIRYNKVMKRSKKHQRRVHQGWMKEADIQCTRLNLTLLDWECRVFDFGHVISYVVDNYDGIRTLVRNGRFLRNLGLPIPERLVTTWQARKDYRPINAELEYLLMEKRRIEAKVPPVFAKLIIPHVMEAERVLFLATNSYFWSMINLKPYLKKCEKAIWTLGQLVEKICNVVEFNVKRQLDNIWKLSLCDLPATEPLPISTVLAETKELCEKSASIIDKKSHLIEAAVVELVQLVLGKSEFDEDEEEEDEEDEFALPSTSSLLKERPASVIPLETRRKERMDLEQEASSIVSMYQNETVEQMLRLAQRTLDSLRRRFTVHTLAEDDWLLNFTSGRRKAVKVQPSEPCFYGSLTLSVPRITTEPPLDEAQTIANELVKTILGTFKTVTRWQKFTGSLTADIEYKKMLARKEEERRRLAEAVAAEADKKTDEFDDYSDESDTEKAKAEEASQLAVNEGTAQKTAASAAGKVKNYFSTINDHKHIAKLRVSLSSSIVSLSDDVSRKASAFNRFTHLWMYDRDKSVADYLAHASHLEDIKEKLIYYERLVSEINAEPDTVKVGPFSLDTIPLKQALTAECHAWKSLYGRDIKKRYHSEMEKMWSFIDESDRKLKRPIKDLDDIRVAMAALAELRDREIAIDASISPVEESYAFLVRHGIDIAQEEIDRVDSLRLGWTFLCELVTNAQETLREVQPKFREDLVHKVNVFQEDAFAFYDDYDTNGPMVQDLDPREASARLTVYQVRFDDLWRKYGTYSDGEHLFGMDVNQYDGLQRIRKELNLLQKLYGLYNTVNMTVDGYHDILWPEVDLEKINGEILDFQNRCRKLPKGLRGWPAFLALKKKVDDFNETCPLLEMMSHKAMQKRHWDRITALTKYDFDFESDQFQLKSVIEAPLLKYKDEIEDICIAAVKERDIEAKLKAVILDWDLRELEFADFKNKPMAILKMDHVSESIGAIEDSMMVLSSLSSNRYNVPFKTKIVAWMQKLTTTNDIVDNWVQVQNLWIYLEAVFVGGDISKQLPKEAKRFTTIDKSWQKVMTHARENANIITCCTGDEMLRQLLPHLLAQLEQCQKSLAGYLEQKRLTFPRFFFVSDPVLLEILGKASDPQSIQAHLLSIFDNIKSVTFHHKDQRKIVAVNSREPETIKVGPS